MSPVLAAALAVATLALAGCSGAGLEPLGGVGTDEGFGRCDAYEGRGQAQRAWRDAGRPASADRDGDGRVCESLASRGSGGSGAGSSSARSSSSEGVAQTTGCERPSRPVVVTYSRREYPHITDHIEDAQRAGYPRVMRIKREAPMIAATSCSRASIRARAWTGTNILRASAERPPRRARLR